MNFHLLKWQPIRNNLTSCKHPQVWNNTFFYLTGQGVVLGKLQRWWSQANSQRVLFVNNEMHQHTGAVSQFCLCHEAIYCALLKLGRLLLVFFACLFLLTCQFKWHAWLQHGTYCMRRHWKTHFWLLGATRSVAASNFCLFDFRIPCLGIFVWVGWWYALV